MYNDDFQLHASGKAGVGEGGRGGAYMTWLLLATEPSKLLQNYNFVKHCAARTIVYGGVTV